MRIEAEQKRKEEDEKIREGCENVKTSGSL